jgi:murein DD-endopeptidase MepM/ murein hydrolase activator NlpD
MILADSYAEELEKQSKEIQTLIQDQLGRDSSSPIVRVPGKFVDPIQAPVTSEFGYRTHPISGAQRLHAGRDYGADTGTPIVSTEDGTVTYATWMQGYGNTIIVDHGGGITSLYAHASALVASEGQSVKAGETVSLVGSTGYSTGPHLHFEIHENGNPVDPRGYLP